MDQLSKKTAPLGKLEACDLRSCWSDEARDFTPWLAGAEGLGLLQEALGIELQVVRTEVPVGPYCADILATDLATNQPVVIENQLERTNHDHLGKALTYAAVLGAPTVVWIAKRVTDEHRKAIEWLNEISGGALQMFGVELQLWRIGNSPPAVRFDVVCAPNEVVRQAGEAASGSGSETRQLQLAFWTEMKKELERTQEFRSLRAPRPQYWYDIAIGRAGINLSLTADTFGKRVAVKLILIPARATQALDQLTPMREAIEQEIGAKLDWNPHPEKPQKTIRLVREGDISDRSQWATLTTWLGQTAVAFRRAFGARVAHLDLSSVSDEAVADS